MNYNYESPNEYWEKNRSWFFERNKIPFNLENLIKIAYVEGLVAGMKSVNSENQIGTPAPHLASNGNG